MKKYRQPLTQNEIDELSELSKLNFSSFSEADVREEYLVPILKILGYKKESDYSVSREETFRLNPLFLRVGSKNVRLDYLCSLRKEYFWLIDAKKGECTDSSHPPEIREEDICQAYFYSLHPKINCKYFAVSNGWFFNVYDRDLIDDSLNPVLKIKHTEIVEKIYQLDYILGSTQIIPNLKRKLLDEIEKVLSSEVYIDRLDEFVMEVKLTVNKIKPQVLNHWYLNTQKEKKDRENYWTDTLTESQPSEIINNLFQFACTPQQMDDVANALVEKLEQQSLTDLQQYLLMQELFLTGPKSVSYRYYSNVLNFLLRLNNSRISQIRFPLNGKKDCSSREALLYWLELLLSRFETRRELRLILLFEGLFRRSTKFYLVMLKSAREGIENEVSTQKYLLPEEKIAWMGPSPVFSLIELVEKITLQALGDLVLKFFDKNKKLNLAMKEYIQMNSSFLTVYKKNEQEYLEIQSELGSNRGELLFFDDMFSKSDPVLSIVCKLLLVHPEIVEELSSEAKRQLGIVASLGCANFARELCDLSSINYSCVQDSEKREKALADYFNPNYNPGKFSVAQYLS